MVMFPPHSAFIQPLPYLIDCSLLNPLAHQIGSRGSEFARKENTVV